MNPEMYRQRPRLTRAELIEGAREAPQPPRPRKPSMVNLYRALRMEAEPSSVRRQIRSTTGMEIVALERREDKRRESDLAEQLMTRIIAAVCDSYGVTFDALLSDRRTKLVTWARQVAMYLCRKIAFVSFPRISARLNRNHSTAVHAFNLVIFEMREDPRIAQQIADLSAQFSL